MKTLTMPMQPIENMRFIPNRIVRTILDVGPIDLNKIGIMDFTPSERQQFAQLIGYSLGGYEELSYVTKEAYDAAYTYATMDVSEQTARIMALTVQLEKIKRGLEIAACEAFGLHPDDMKGE